MGSVDGALVREAASIEKAKRALEGAALFERVWAVWSRWPEPASGSPKQQRAELLSRTSLLASFLELAESIRALDAGPRKWLARQLEETVSTEDIQSAVERRIAEVQLARLRSERDELAGQLLEAIRGKDVVPPIESICQAIAAEDIGALKQALADLGDAEADRMRHQPYEEFVRRLSACAPRLGAEMRESEGDSRWRAKIIGLETAWLHKRASCWIQQVLSKDTWRDGIHSYLSYLRDRLTIARELLTESGSIFVQIGDRTCCQ